MTVNAGLVLASPRDFAMYGLRVRSEFHLSGWPSPDDRAEPDVTVIGHPVPAPALSVSPHMARSRVDADGFTIAVGGVARYQARNGAEIRVDPEPGVKPEDLLLYLTGALIGVVLHQRGAFPLHASAVAAGAGAVAFAGPSGAGKSTLVTAMLRRGAAFVTDDISVLAERPDGIHVWPGAPRAKLDDAALAALNQAAGPLESAGGNRGKFHLPVGRSRLTVDQAPLRTVYVITDGDGPARLEPLPAMEAVAALVDETYLLQYAAALGLAPQCFRLAARVARSVRVCRLVRPRGIEHLERVMDLVYDGAGTDAGFEPDRGGH